MADIKRLFDFIYEKDGRMTPVNVVNDPSDHPIYSQIEKAIQQIPENYKHGFLNAVIEQVYNGNADIIAEELQKDGRDEEVIGRALLQGYSVIKGSEKWKDEIPNHHTDFEKQYTRSMYLDIYSKTSYYAHDRMSTWELLPDIVASGVHGFVFDVSPNGDNKISYKYVFQKYIEDEAESVEQIIHALVLVQMLLLYQNAIERFVDYIGDTWNDDYTYELDDSEPIQSLVSLIAPKLPDEVVEANPMLGLEGNFGEAWAIHTVMKSIPGGIIKYNKETLEFIKDNFPQDY